MSELYLSDVTLRESRPRSRRLRDLGYVVRSYPETAPVSTASGSILDTILIPHYDDAGNLVSLESTVDFWSEKMISAGGLAAGGDGNVSADEDLASSKIVIGDGAKKVKSSGYEILSYLGDDTSSYLQANTVPTTKAIKDYVDAHSGGGGGGNVSADNDLTADRFVMGAGGKKIKAGTYSVVTSFTSSDNQTNDKIPTALAVKNYNASRLLGYAFADVDMVAGKAIVWEGSRWTLGTVGSGSSYTLPAATSTRLGGIKVGAGLVVADDGTLSAPGGGTTSGITEDYANGRYIRRDGTNTGDEKITFAKGIRIGSASAGVDITYDSANGALKINGKAYTTGDLSGGGLASGSGDSGVDIITSLSASSTNDQVLGARALYNILGDLETALNNLL